MLTRCVRGSFDMAAKTTADILPPRYRSVETLAHGGMAVIYKATDEALGREVAVKVLAERYAREDALRARFTREALAAARLSGDSSTVTIFDVGEWHDRPYLVMELAAGGTVAERIDAGDVALADTLQWLEQAGAALDAAHARGVVHRDVKPANLLLTADGNVRVADFGIASAAGLTSLTATGTVLGTLGYLAPEQAMGREVGPAADRYALGVVAYELLAGRRPFEGGAGAAEAAAAARAPVPQISRDRPDLPAALDPIFARALAKEPADRYDSCAELVGDLRRAFEEAAGSTRAWASSPVAAVGERARWLPLALGVALLAAGGIVAAVLLGGGANEPASAPAIRTVTAQGKTVTVTTRATTAATAPTTAPPASSSSSGAALNDAGWQRMKAGDYAGARPLLEQAVQKLQGTGSLAEAYADYNLAFTRLSLGSCDGVLELLDRSEAVQGYRSEIASLRKDARKCR
jgi:eukaryotic-like serine/threonine-protein kinase